MIITNDLCKIYGEKPVVKDLNMHAKKGSIYGLIGLNGAGKTTTLGMLSGLIKPTSGTFTIGGYSMDESSKIRDIISLMPQDSHFHNERTVMSHMELYCGLKDVDIFKAEELLIHLGLGEKLYTKVKALSHGMVKRLNLSQALIAHPQLIMLDEPLSGLDPKTKSHIRAAIKKYSKKSTVVISSHELDEVEALCDYVGIIHKGTIIKESKVASLTLPHKEVSFKIANLNEKMINAVDIKYVKDVITAKNTITVIYSKDISQKLTNLLLKNKAKILSIRKGKRLEEVFLSEISNYDL